MNGPLGRLRALQSNLENAVKNLTAFDLAVTEISSDPLVGGPAAPLAKVLATVRALSVQATAAFVEFNDFADPLLGEDQKRHIATEDPRF